ncbi:TM2 domain protein [Methanobrevibacter cuticularis]|uniref:TM2 domain protein n=1 Tax=Methanobrevibacter cuticularis TaxID=47311 RepID=A0A166CU25_9EURY|nr:zinc ribbon domain-containing protein [Methanobrevibacter cuticularis]KZX16817.1 TM2 domain protein [Methanobrevibacter cuticularis]
MNNEEAPNFCPICGDPIKDKKTNFCPNCGTKLRENNFTSVESSNKVESRPIHSEWNGKSSNKLGYESLSGSEDGENSSDMEFESLNSGNGGKSLNEIETKAVTTEKNDENSNSIESQPINNPIARRINTSHARYVNYYKNPKLALVLSLFLVCLGQFYNGQILKGVLFMILTLFLSDINGLLGVLALLYSAYDAYENAKKINENNGNYFYDENLVVGGDLNEN